jgi:hypothetical protein
MARLLNAGVLPAGYYAVPFLDRDGPMEIDVAALRDNAISPSSAVAPERPMWSPDIQQTTVAIEWPEADDIRVEIFSDEGDPRLAAAIELVSPRNKDRPKAREAFAAKCAEHLRHGRGLVVIDTVTTRRADLRAELLIVLGDNLPPERLESATLVAISYQPVAGQSGDGQLLSWPAELQIGQRLPTLPLWLAPDLAVPLDLEASHAAACNDLRIAAWPRPA